jgi:riboflavin synthase
MLDREEQTLFTGIVEQVGRIDTIEKGPEGGRLRIHAGPLAASLAVAGSVAVNGCCLTVVELAGETFAADLSSETLRAHRLWRDEAGRARQSRAAAHRWEKNSAGISCRATSTASAASPASPPRDQTGGSAVRVPAEVERYVAMKGSIAIDGISLTVASLADGVAEVAIIPFTYANTNLQALVAGDAVNLEADILAKYVEKLLDSAPRARALAHHGRPPDRRRLLTCRA